MKAFIQQQITKKAKKILATYKPLVITVSGSVGKTSTRNAIATMLSTKYRVGTTIKNYNNEFGVPLTILGYESPGKSFFGWLKILCSKPRNIPEIFVLEYGIDHPGDMKHLCDIASPDICVLTRLSPVHAEHFRSLEQLAEEKAVMIDSTKPEGLVLLNADDPLVLGLRGHAHTPVVTYGFSSGAQVRASEYQLETREDFSFEPGEHFSTVRVHVQMQDQTSIDVELKNMLGQTCVSALLPAIIIAQRLNLSQEEIISSLAAIVFEPGRMNPIPGIKGSLLIDSSYNAAPASMNAALEVLCAFHPSEKARRIAVLGHMAELGGYREQEHRMLGMRAAELGVDLLVTVGDMTREIRRAAIEAGIPEVQTQHFDTPVHAGRWLDAQIKKGDIVLIKGSQSARMEKVVKDLMAEPLRAAELLVRQSKDWQ
ncbi:UDP-N-acetylmuramoyl-tripeptide--D-alanyl-D-alanine ligase [Candidatus Uhrbacteria bacterium]|nr:UDP-N-acetylmuramoyl-tripeptide--D-alanyl-D-alanine ligase [Candidatus Uhrbacteria bacterium]